GAGGAGAGEAVLAPRAREVGKLGDGHGPLWQRGTRRLAGLVERPWGEPEILGGNGPTRLAERAERMAHPGGGEAAELPELMLGGRPKAARLESGGGRPRPRGGPSRAPRRGPAPPPPRGPPRVAGRGDGRGRRLRRQPGRRPRGRERRPLRADRVEHPLPRALRHLGVEHDVAKPDADIGAIGHIGGGEALRTRLPEAEAKPL